MPEAERDRPDGAAIRRIVVFLGVAGLGWAVGSLFHTQVSDSTGAYLRAITVLLAIGLFASVQDIDRGEARREWRTVLLAITVGVLLKAAIITGVLYLCFREPRYLVLGIAVAQIDPISFAAIGRRSDMSRRTRTVLAAWASFDDPVTVVLTIFMSSWALSLTARGAPAGDVLMNVAGDIGQLGGTLLSNLFFVLVAGGLWLTTLIGRSRDGRRRAELRNAVQVVLVVLLIGVAVQQFLLLGLAFSALFIRPRLGPALRWAATGAFQLGTFALGLLLVGGINPLAGVVLGVAAYGAQVVAGSLAAARWPRRDRADLALAQQSGITAVILALLLEDPFPGTVGVVAPAIVTVNVLHLVCNGFRRRDGEATDAGARSGPIAGAVSDAPSRQAA